MHKLLNSTFYVKLTHWEYWNFYVVYFCTIFYYVYLSLKAKTFFFFTASNPGIENGGFIGESKSEIFKKISHEYLPDYIFVKPEDHGNAILDLLKHKSIEFPFIAKPDIGERGQGIAKIEGIADFTSYHNQINVPYLIQAYVGYELELGVFYYRYPNENTGVVSSVVQKGFLTVVGDGFSTLMQLIEILPRARFRRNYLEQKFKNQVDLVVPIGEIIELEGIGNHSRGTTFLNANHIINPKLISVFDEISKEIDGFYFGRFDLRCKSLEDLYKGENIKILELNGAGAEPAHIYQPGFPFWEGQRVLFHHWKVLFEISQMNIKNGIKPLTYKEAKLAFKAHSRSLEAIGI